MKIGCLGPQGTFSQVALSQFMLGKGAYDEVLMKSIPELILAADKGLVDYAFVPVENSIEGGINTTLDMLAFDTELTINAEYVFKVHQDLMVKQDLTKAEIEVIYSHPQPIGQCIKYIDENLKAARIEMVASTAEAAKIVASSSQKAAVIGGCNLAGLYGLSVLERQIEDNIENCTRFIQVGNSNAPATGQDKTSIVFGAEHKPGYLYKMLSIFNIFEINLLRIESRPAKTILGEYVFFVDIEGHIEDKQVAQALGVVKEKAKFYSLLGSYPKSKR